MTRSVHRSALISGFHGIMKLISTVPLIYLSLFMTENTNTLRKSGYTILMRKFAQSWTGKLPVGSADIPSAYKCPSGCGIIVISANVALATVTTMRIQI